MGPDEGLRFVKAALARMSDRELDLLSEETYRLAPGDAPALLAWLDYACMWQLQRRAGQNNEELLPPEASIAEKEIAVTIEAATALRAKFKHSHTVREFFDALMDVFVGGRANGRWA